MSVKGVITDLISQRRELHKENMQKYMLPLAASRPEMGGGHPVEMERRMTRI